MLDNLGKFWNDLLSSKRRPVWVLVWGVFLLFCLIRVLYVSLETQPVAAIGCQETADESIWQPEDWKAAPRIASIKQMHASFPGSFCLVVAGAVSHENKDRVASGVAAAEKNYRAAEKAANALTDENAKAAALTAAMKAARLAASETVQGLPPIDIAVFINGVKQPFLTRKIFQTPLPQAILIEMNNKPVASAKPGETLDAAGIWRGILGGPTMSGHRLLHVGITRGNADLPENVFATPLKVKMHDRWALAMGGISLAAFLIVFLSISRHSSLLRDGSLTNHDPIRNDIKALEDSKADTQISELSAVKSMSTQEDKDRQIVIERGKIDTEITRLKNLIDGPNITPITYDSPYSLARSQMAFWGIIVFCSFVFLWLTLGQINGIMKVEVLGLLGISATTGLISVYMQSPADPQARTKGFWSDILNDGDGPKFHRIQAVAWTLLLGLVFIWTVTTNFSLIILDPNLLILIGFANGSYVSFKMQEKAK